MFASGQQWQFKGWKYERPIDLFSHGKCWWWRCQNVTFYLSPFAVKGFYAKWADESIKGPASGWNVTPLDVSIQRERESYNHNLVWGSWSRPIHEHARFQDPNDTMTNSVQPSFGTRLTSTWAYIISMATTSSSRLIYVVMKGKSNHHKRWACIRMFWGGKFVTLALFGSAWFAQWMGDRRGIIVQR